MAVLLLNVDYSPIEVISWRRAVIKLFDGKVEVVEDYADRVLRSPSTVLPFPAVVRHVGPYVARRPSFSRRNILARDAYTCQYCGARPRRKSGLPDLEDLTIDHVVPRVQAVDGRVRLPWSGETVAVTSWQNVLTACRTCNSRKGGRTPREAGMNLHRIPTAPTPADLIWMDLHRVRIPEEWKFYLPEESPWRGYWEVELDEG